MDQMGDAVQGLINLLDMLGGLIRKALSREEIRLNEEFRARDNTWLRAVTLLALVLVVLLLLSCGQEPGKTSPYNASGFDTAKNEAAGNDPVRNGAVPVTANDLARTMIEGPIPERLDETTVQLLIDSLSSSDQMTRQLQARALTKLWPRADGASAESMAMAALEYVSDHPSEFIALFDQDLGEQDLPIWADMLAQELLIDSEDGPLKAWAERVPHIQRGCSPCTAAQRERLDVFLRLVAERVHALNKAI